MFVRVSRSRVFVQLDLDYMHSKVFIKNGTLTTRFGNNIPFDKLTFRYNTIGIPIVLGGLVVKKPSYKMRLYTGLEVDLVTKIKAQYTQNNIDFTSSLRKKDKRDLIRPAQFSYQMGMGMDVAMFIMDFRYNLGFRNFIKNNIERKLIYFKLLLALFFNNF
ncbi:MAG: outer membrane beta-barrel protein [Saprospirales bacterium]|nr:outer membrane beta-barrel protein [Saprospirales bacterium]